MISMALESRYRNVYSRSRMMGDESWQVRYCARSLQLCNQPLSTRETEVGRRRVGVGG